MLLLAIILFLIVGIALGTMLGTILIGIGLILLYFAFDANFSVVGNSIWNTFSGFALTAVPLFILMGEILAETGVARRIYNSIAPLFERLPGRLLQTNIATCTAFSAVCGSSSATAAVVGSIAYPELASRGYSNRSILGSIAGGGTLGILLPPSVAMIIYGAWQNVSVSSLFMAGIVPGLMIMLFFMIMVGVGATLFPSALPVREGPPPPLGSALRSALGAIPFFVLIVSILGTIFAGLATPTEAAAIGVAAAIFLAAAYRSLTLGRLWTAVQRTVLTFGSLSLIFVGGIVLSQAVALAGYAESISAGIEGLALGSVALIALIYLIYILLGTVLGPIEMMLITFPFVLPVIIKLGYDPVWFGVAYGILSEIGLITPPVGSNLFMAVAVTKGKATIADASIGSLPYAVVLLMSLILITLFPQIALFLPELSARTP